jgi:hypothetical protein
MFFGELGEGDRGRILLDPALEVVDTGAIRHSGDYAEITAPLVT